MKTELSAGQIEQYRTHGFLVIDDFLDADELAVWQQATDEAVEQRLASTKTLTNQKDPDTFYAQVFTQCLRLATTHPVMHELMYDPRLGEVAGTLAGVDGIRIWHDQALYKPPYGNPTGFHLDNPFWSFYSKDAISIWVALDDATIENGCLWYLPGTHKKATFEATPINENLGGIFKMYPEWRQLTAVAAPVAAGGVVFHNGLVAHAAGVNLTPRARRAMTCAYMPDGSTFNGQRNILTKAYFETLTVGDTLNNEDENPLIWRKK
ncbi:MAG: phytanoyl-CoA dioxygenase family protein [Caldilineaceae bacterium]|nr:phytanoyl-CoA dioxygenase family protein [Caldilineaceae bacterium]